MLVLVLVLGLVPVLVVLCFRSCFLLLFFVLRCVFFLVCCIVARVRSRGREERECIGVRIILIALLFPRLRIRLARELDIVKNMRQTYQCVRVRRSIVTHAV